MQDPHIQSLIRKELARQKNGLEMIPSENYASGDVRKAMGSILTNKYSEGYPGKRYYGGNEYIDEVELLAQDRAKKLFGVQHVNVQPYSGSPANFAVYLAVCTPGDVVMGLNLPDGGHLTHGWKASATALFFKSVPYHVRPDGHVDLEEVRRLALEHKPKLMWVGATAYPYQYEFVEFAKIADEVGAYLVADIAHVAGLVVAGAHPSPVPHVHIVTTTTHKTLRGPRGGMIMVTQKGLDKDATLPEKIDRAIIPGFQGGPHNHQTAAIATALLEAAQPSFQAYGKQIVKNAKALAKELKKSGVRLVGDGTENHLLLLDLIPTNGPGAGCFVQDALGTAGITVNKNTIPGEPSSPFYPSGVRMGTPAITTRGFQEKDMEQVGKWIARVIAETTQWKLPDTKEKRIQALKDFRVWLKKNTVLKTIAREIHEYCKDFPLPR